MLKPISPLTLIPVGIFAFLGGAALGRTRKGLSMATPKKGSPIDGVPLARWERFVTIMAVAPRQRVTPRYRLGTFGMDARRLSDVGFMVAPRKAAVGGETGVWIGEWKHPLTTDKFLGSMPAQYLAFKRSMSRLATRVSGFVGADVDGTKCSLSGLLGVGHLAGEAGVESWVKSPDVRKRFKSTTANFVRANGIF
jgi:hypothetical protein